MAGERYGLVRPDGSTYLVPASLLPDLLRPVAASGEFDRARAYLDQYRFDDGLGTGRPIAFTGLLVGTSEHDLEAKLRTLRSWAEAATCLARAGRSARALSAPGFVSAAPTQAAWAATVTLTLYPANLEAVAADGTGVYW